MSRCARIHPVLERDMVMKQVIAGVVALVGFFFFMALTAAVTAAAIIV